MSGLSIAPMFPLLGAEFDLNLTQLGLLTGGTVIANGYSNLIIIPFSNVFGRRGTLLFFGLIMLACHVWSASAKSYDSLLAARVVVGAATGTAETIMVQMTADMFFLHERGFWMGVYLLVRSCDVPEYFSY
jgi:predicted MFS family arabinose efflux permease